MSAGPPRAVRARAWCRVDLAGGTLDIWPLGLLHPGARTVNLAIDVAARVEITRLERGFRVLQDGGRVEGESPTELTGHPDAGLLARLAAVLELPPVEISVASESPRGGGLGASSAIAVAVIAAGERLQGAPERTPAARSELARDVEAVVMGLPAGAQDHFPGQLGGALEIRHLPGGQRVRRLAVDLAALGRSLVVAYSGRSHFSGGNNWEVVRRRLGGDPDSVRCFQGIADAASELVPLLESGRLAAAGAVVEREWALRRELAAAVSTPELERMLAAARDAGAWGGKACGAGGGGCLAVLCPPENRAAVEAALSGAGAEPLAARPVDGPIVVETVG